jgi:hypothetical protein
MAASLAADEVRAFVVIPWIPSGLLQEDIDPNGWIP